MTEYTPYEAREALEHSLQTEQELGIEIIPGTKVMRDTEHIKFIRAKPQGAVLVPQPSNDRHDPLNWSKTRKALVMIISPFFVFGLASGPLSIATQFNSLIQAFNSDLEAVVQIVLAKLCLTNTVDRYYCSHCRILQLSMDPDFYEFRTSCRAYMEYNHLLDFLNLAWQSYNVQEFYVGFCFGRYRYRPRRGDYGR